MGKSGLNLLIYENFLVTSFLGSYRYSLDSKGRVNIPARIRKAMSPEANETFVITRGMDGCLFAYPQNEWIKIEQKLRNLSMTQKVNRFFVRSLSAYATEASYDKQGRIPIPAHLAEFAGIEREVLIIGTLDRLEIWSPKVYEEYIAGSPETFESVAENIILRGESIE